MDEQRRSALDWLAKAERDYEAARRMIDEPGEPLLDAGVFHCQQAAEKALKGWLTGRGVAVTKTHDLVHLVRLCAAEDEGFSLLIPAADFLSPFAVEFRYPGDIFEPPQEEADRALRDARAILDAVSDSLQ
ncbi:MAG: HEPN domain-containing protein [Chthoniobacterales bacterium]